MYAFFYVIYEGLGGAVLMFYNTCSYASALALLSHVQKLHCHHAEHDANVHLCILHVYTAVTDA